jgi:hypothetical protein
MILTHTKSLQIFLAQRNGRFELLVSPSSYVNPGELRLNTPTRVALSEQFLLSQWFGALTDHKIRLSLAVNTNEFERKSKSLLPRLRSTAPSQYHTFKSCLKTHFQEPTHERYNCCKMPRLCRRRKSKDEQGIGEKIEYKTYSGQNDAGREIRLWNAISGIPALLNVIFRHIV